MNAPFRSSMRELHSRAGLVLGWLGIFLFFMGSLALYRYEITFWMQPETHHAAQRGSTREKIEAARAGLAYLTRRAPDAEMWRVNPAHGTLSRTLGGMGQRRGRARSSRHGAGTVRS